MKYLFGIVVLVVAVLAALFLVPLENGRSLLDGDRVHTWVRETVRTVAPDQSGWVDNSETATLYRWQDTNGNWQYGDAPPSGVRAEPVQEKEVRTVSGNEPLQGGSAPDSSNNP